MPVPAPLPAKNLLPVDPGPSVVVCSTCRQSRPGDGASLAAHLRAAQAQDPALRGVAVQAMPCLFACDRACTVHIRAPGRIGYVLGGFAPDAAAAHAILTYAAHHAASVDGVVAYADWPDGVKGHFITRTPPEGFVCR